ncbi:MAG: putative Zn-dependent peptidase [Candidatus Midichloriaceae bacterium]|jgi:predicted Zn-dependent peptidase
MGSVNSVKNSHGLIVGTDKMANIETVTVSILVKNGSRNEQKVEGGISHFLEHMAFKGTSKRTAREIAEEFDLIGGYFNAYTSRTATVYYAKILKDDLDKAVDILTDIFLNSTFSAEELDKEREVIMQELCMTRDTPDDIVFDYFQETAFPKQALGRSILGEEEFIKNLTRDHLISYYKKRYSTKNTIISAAGNLDTNKFNDEIGAKFKNFNDNEVDDWDKGVYVGGELHVKKDLEQAQFVFGLEGVSYLDADFYDMQILSMILGGGMSSRLFQKIREERGLVYNISSFTNSYDDCGVFGIYSALNPQNMNLLIDLVIEELHSLTQEIYEDEILRAKAQVKSSLLMSMESSISRAKKICNNFALFGKYITNDEILDKINKIDKHSLVRVAVNLLKNKNFTITTLGNVEKIYNYNKIVNKLKV